jgi:hypothetical protein
VAATGGAEYVWSRVAACPTAPEAAPEAAGQAPGRVPVEQEGWWQWQWQ